MHTANLRRPSRPVPPFRLLKGNPMRLPRDLKQRWQQYPTLRALLRATENLSHSPFGQTEDGLADFRGIRLIADQRSPEVLAKLTPSNGCP